MEDLKVVTASNIINLRTAAGMTQLELAELLSYSDKSVSKWERAEAVPDAYVLKKMSEIFGVTVDYILSTHEEWKPKPAKKETSYSSGMITAISIIGIWSLALLVFIILWLADMIVWLPFLYAIPLSLITFLVLNSVWKKGKNNYYIIAALILSIVLTIYVTFIKYNWWQLFLLLIPAGLVVFLSSRIKKRKK